MPLFILLIGGGLILFCGSRALPLRRLPDALRLLRERSDAAQGCAGQISSAKALASVVAATVGMGNIAGVAIALAMGGPGAIFWMWVSALVGMASKYHEGVLAIAYRETGADGSTFGGPMYIIRKALLPRWRWMACCFAIAGMVGTLCIMNANQLTEAAIASMGIDDSLLPRLAIGLCIASVVALVVLGGIRRIAAVASFMVPFMVGIYFVMVAIILVCNLSMVPEAFSSIFREAFSLRAGWGALIGVALIGARRAMLVNDAGVGTASIMHSESRNDNPVKEGLIAMLGPAIDSGFVCTLTALALLVTVDFNSLPSGDIQGLSLAMSGFGSAIPGGRFLLMVVVSCFALSSMFSYSFYGNRCAAFLFGPRGARFHTILFILSLALFAVVPLSAAVALCDLFYFFMALPTMSMLLMLRRRVAAITSEAEKVARGSLEKSPA
ncbi:MAG: alanine:cation symporter family protein [Pseudoflavonifractor sp.]|nr:alanine:cation symporter family protein [Alloprevotella sp.]MCM1117039.1 alanine:cation symporter family protein [Pseudoflavonifractor sp.]